MTSVEQSSSAAAEADSEVLSMAPTAEQDQLRDSVRRFLRARSPEDVVRRDMETADGFDAAIWAELAGSLGLSALAIPEEYGGAGFTFADLSVALEEAGRALVCAPLLSSAVLATQTLLATDDEDAKRRYLPSLADGTRRATLVIDVKGTAAQGFSLEDTADGLRLRGSAEFVLDGHTADDIFVAVPESGGVSLVAFDGADSAITRRRQPTFDLTRPLARIDVDAVVVTRIGAPGSATAAVARGVNCARVALACEAVGGSDAVLESAVSYAKTRRQFGRLIGSFQAIKHMCADMFIEAEPGRAAAAYAARVVDTADADELAIAAAVAKAWCGETYVHSANTNIQVHGGIGFTWEHSAHLFLKRAKANQVLFGDVHQQRTLIAEAAGLELAKI
jgi:alkylation response protein AidB-like acyl-CoA dehydrogenase